MLRRRISGHAVLIALLVAISTSSEGGQATPPGQRGPVKPVPGGPRIPVLPDLTITSATVTTACVGKNVTANIEATVKNGDKSGLADLSKIPFSIVMDATFASIFGSSSLEESSVKPVNPQAGGPKSLKPGETWTTKMTITGMPRFKPGLTKPGQYVFSVNADPVKGVTESDEKNNQKLAYAYDPCFGK